MRELRRRIDVLGGQLRDKEASRREARDALRASERAISEADRRLRGLYAEAQRTRGELRSLAEREQALGKFLRDKQAALAAMLAAHRSGGAPELLRALLSGDDPLALARRFQYLQYLSREHARAIAAARAALMELRTVRQGRETRAAHLVELSAAERVEQAKIESERRARLSVLDRVAGDIRRARREIGALQADEARLSRLVDELGKLFAARRAERAPSGTVQPGGTRFSRLRGQLRPPVRGELLSRFGAQNDAGAGTGKGIFIAAAAGLPVRAVAQGQVVFADWMRGFGNLLIVDHGEAYLSVYANNESLLKQPGESVTAGETVATVGASGGSEKSGLYFELRHLGKAFDPLGWIR